MSDWDSIYHLACAAAGLTEQEQEQGFEPMAQRCANCGGVADDDGLGEFHCGCGTFVA